MSKGWMEGLRTLCRSKCSLERTGKTWSIFLEPEVIGEAARRLNERGFFLEDITGLDTSDGLVAVYHFDSFARPGRVALYVVVPREDPEIPSISDIFGGAEWHERECHDFFGIRFSGHPNPVPLLLPDDMDYHPLIKGEEDRVFLRDFLDPGEVVEVDPEFTIFDAVKRPDAPDSAPDEGK